MDTALLIREIRFDLDLMVFDLRFLGDQHPAREFVEVKIGIIERDIVPFDAGKAEQVGDEIGKALRFFEGDRKVFILVFLGEGAVLNALQIALHRSQRRAEFVGNVRDEIAPGSLQ